MGEPIYVPSIEVDTDLSLQGDGRTGRVILLFGHNAPRYLAPEALYDDRDHAKYVPYDPTDDSRIALIDYSNVVPPQDTDEGTVAITTNYRNPLYFHIQEERMRTTGVLQANESSRFRTLIQALGGATEEYRDLTVEKAKLKRETVVKEITKKVIIGSFSYSSEEIFPISVAIATLTASLKDQNHPSWQLFEQMEREYPDIGAGILKGLRRQILEAVHSDDLLALYNNKKREFKQSLRDKKA